MLGIKQKSVSKRRRDDAKREPSGLRSLMWLALVSSWIFRKNVHNRRCRLLDTRIFLGAFAFSCATFFVSVSSFAFDPKRDTIPGVWVEDVVPENALPPVYREYFNELDKARAQVGAGQCRRALATLYAFEPSDAQRVDVAILRATALATIGRRDEAVGELSEADMVDRPEAQVLRAKILADAGRPVDAIALLRSLVVANPDSLSGRLLLGQLLEQTGEFDGARAVYEWFVTGPTNYLERWRAKNDPMFDSAETTVTVARAIDRWATLGGQYAKMASLHQTILDMLVTSYDRIDRTYRPARVGAAEFFLARDDPQNAGEELEAAMAMNAFDPYVLNLIGKFAAKGYKLDEAGDIALSLDRIESGSRAGALLTARIVLRNGHPDVALPMIRRVLERHSTDVEALSLLAVAQALKLDEAGLAGTLKQIDAIDPRNATSRIELADALNFSHQDERALPYWKEAVERAPWWATPRHQLGKANMEIGFEDDARVALEAAYSTDPFNATTVNFLRLLDDMQKFKRYESKSLRFLFTPDDERVVVDHFAPYLDSVWPALCERFGYTPPWKPTIQIFPDKDTFSVRVAGLPGFENYGVAQGRTVITLSPRASASMGTFNWARVLTHELAHTVHLSKTGGRVPRWLTEGLAVSTERVAVRFEWVPPLLWDAATNDRLPALTTLTESIQRPKRPTDGELGYMTGFWVGEFVESLGGRDAIVRLLQAYADGKTDDDAFTSAVGMSVGVFEPKFRAWAKDKVKTWGYDEATTTKYKEFETRANDLMKSNQLDDAIKLWNDAHALQPMNLTPHRRLAGLYIKQNRAKDALPHLEALVPLELSDNRFSKRIARIYRDTGDLPTALKKAEEAIYIAPYDATAHDLLAELHDQAGDTALATRDRTTAKELREQEEKRKKAKEALPR